MYRGAGWGWGGVYGGGDMEGCYGGAINVGGGRGVVSRMVTAVCVGRNRWACFVCERTSCVIVMETMWDRLRCLTVSVGARACVCVGIRAGACLCACSHVTSDEQQHCHGFCCCGGTACPALSSWCLVLPRRQWTSCTLDAGRGQPLLPITTFSIAMDPQVVATANTHPGTHCDQAATRRLFDESMPGMVTSVTDIESPMSILNCAEQEGLQ